VELVDTPDLKFVGMTRAGSSPAARTNQNGRLEKLVNSAVSKIAATAWGFESPISHHFTLYGFPR
jgi:hypothetical protein